MMVGYPRYRYVRLPARKQLKIACRPVSSRPDQIARKEARKASALFWAAVSDMK
jgi:hypothetical protein